MKKILLVLVLSVLIVGCSPKDMTGNAILDVEQDIVHETGSSLSNTCEETDSGIDKENKGRLSGLKDGKEYNVVDRCIGDFLVEYYCEDDKPMNKNLRCDCVNGAC
jgi:hypothetical protein